MFESTYEGVLPSGVPFSVSEMLAVDQDNLVQRAKKSQFAFADLLFDRLETLGNQKKGDFGKDLVRGMLDADLQYGLMCLRNHSFQDETDFTFTIDFKMEKGEKKKITETHTVDLTTFSVKPYKWVREEIEKLEKEGQSFEEKEFPSMYVSYQDMLDAQLNRVYKFKGGDRERTMKYKLLTGQSMKLRVTSFKHVNDFLAALYVRECKVQVLMKTGKKSKDKKGGTTDEEPIWQQMQWENVPARIQEGFRKEFMDIEGKVDTTARIVSYTNPAKEEQVNFIGLGEFFSPSLAQ